MLLPDQVTALGVVQADGQTGELPMGVNFQVSNDSAVCQCPTQLL